MNRGIIFFIGLLFGILICGMLYYFDIKIFESKYLKTEEKEVITYIKTDTVYLEPLPKPKKQNVDNSLTDTISEHGNENKPSEEDNSIYETAFSLNETKQDEIFYDKLLKTITVKVKPHSKETPEATLPESAFRLFEIQQWSTPIKNKITYYRNQNMLKIRGMDLDNMNVVFLNNVYYLEAKNRYYAIPETERFEKLNPVVLPQ